jgi:hypothetical protein
MFSDSQSERGIYVGFDGLFCLTGRTPSEVAGMEVRGKDKWSKPL